MFQLKFFYLHNSDKGLEFESSRGIGVRSSGWIIWNSRLGVWLLSQASNEQGHLVKLAWFSFILVVGIIHLSSRDKFEFVWQSGSWLTIATHYLNKVIVKQLKAEYNYVVVRDNNVLLSQLPYLLVMS